MDKHISSILKNLPNSPGIYQFFNESGEIIYIGKSVNLKSRVNSYFSGKSKLNFAKKLMVEQIVDIKTIMTNTETESLILEHTLVGQKKPKFNVLLKDDKNYFYIKITAEKFPKILKTRIKWKTGTYYGPYINWPYVFNILRLAKKIFWYGCYGIHFFRTGKQYNLDKYIFKNHIHEWKSVTEEEVEQLYKEKIEEIKKFLKWDISEVISWLESNMKSLASELKFEQAAKIKYDIDSLRSLQEHQIVRDFVSGDFDVVHIIQKYEKNYVGCIEIRDSKIMWFFNHEIQSPLEEDKEEILATFVEQRFAQNYEKRKPIFVIPFPLKNLSPEIKTEIPKIWGKLDILKLCYKNTYEYAHKKHLASLSTKWFTKKTMLELLDILGYKNINKNIVFECNDISHLSGTHTVASRSIIENGKKNPQKYRKFNIKTLEEGKIDDFWSMKEIMERRLKEIMKIKNIPDLIVIDGGKWQLSSVMNIIEVFKKELSQQEDINYIETLQIVSLAKQEEELFLPWKKNSIILQKDSDHLRLIQAIRDEAHRFAITFNRDKRISSMKKSILDSIPGIWPVTKKKILKNYGSLEWLKEQKKEDIERLLGQKITETLEDHGMI